MKRSLLVSSASWAILAGAVALSGCTPLPGGSFDPVYMTVGSKAAPVPPEAPATPQIAARPGALPPLPVSKTTGTIVWVGRYRDSRGGGEMMLSLVQRETTLSGIWKLRTGGGGPFNATGGAEERRLTFRMENTAAECPGRFEGWVKIDGSALVGAYHGRDCQGTVTDGWLELRFE